MHLDREWALKINPLYIPRYWTALNGDMNPQPDLQRGIGNNSEITPKGHDPSVNLLEGHSKLHNNIWHTRICVYVCVTF